jgi:uncharacterized membrane protein YfcA
LELLVHLAWLTPLGLAVGAYGTLIGAGGAFILVPILLLLYPHDEPEVIASISLAVVFFNTASGSVAYARMRRIDYKAAFIFSLAVIPGAIGGAMTTGLVPRRLFDLLLGALMLVLSSYLGLRPHRGASAVGADGVGTGQRPARASEGGRPPGSIRHPYSIGALLSLGVGYVSGLLGVGGGIVHVPALVRVLGFPVHTATATSHMILAVMALAATSVHVASGSFQHGIHRTIALSIGVVLGAQIGAFFSARLRGVWIMRGLALGLLLLGVRLLSVSA